MHVEEALEEGGPLSSVTRPSLPLPQNPLNSAAQYVEEAVQPSPDIPRNYGSCYPITQRAAAATN